MLYPTKITEIIAVQAKSHRAKSEQASVILSSSHDCKINVQDCRKKHMKISQIQFLDDNNMNSFLYRDSKDT